MTTQTAQHSIQNAIQTAIADAHQVCDQAGSDSAACANAWDTVEELQAEASHQKTGYRAKPKTSFEAYCNQNPDADECRVYDV